MGKPKPRANQEVTSKGSLNTPKQGFVQKNKNQKTKHTPTGKINLINGSKAQRNNDKGQKVFQKGNNVSPQKSLQNDKKHQQSQKKQSKVKTIETLVNDEEESDEDVNEGITPMDDFDSEEDDIEDQDSSDDDDDDEDDNDIPNILGASLADDTDDDDFEEDEESEDEVSEKKGVKMFKGLQSKGKSSDSSKDESSNSSKDQDSSFLSDKSETPDDDDDDDDDDEDDEDDDDDDDDEDEDNESEEETALGLKALLGNSIADDDDDDDFDEAGEDEEDDDDDISDEDEEEHEGNNSSINSPNQKVSPKNKSQSPEKSQPEKHTVFVGNLPSTVKRPQLEKLFKKYGEIISLRLRGAVAADEKMSKKVAAITTKLHPKVKSVYAYIAYKTEESAKAALAMNGQVFEGNYLRVDSVNNSGESHSDPKKSVFLGNLPFKADNNTLWEHFKGCGEIESVRIVRDNKTGMGKGFGYVNFVNEDGVALALEMDGTKILNREVRVKKYTNENQGKKRSLSSESGHDASPKKIKNKSETTVSAQNKENAVRRKVEKAKQQGEQKSPQNKSAFQGQKADVKKKKKASKFEQKKKVMAAKLTAKPKKPTT